MQNPNYLLELPDGLAVRDFNEGTKYKVDYVSRYVETFEIAIRKKFTNRSYIELFSGPGKCVIRGTNDHFLGTPLRSLTISHPFTNYFFNDIDQTFLDALKERSSAVTHNAKIEFFLGDANQIVNQLVAKIPANSVNLALLDQDDLDLKWSTVKSLAQIQRMDLIIHYPQMGISRYLPKAYDQDDFPNRMDNFFGDAGWRTIYEDHRKQGSIKCHRDLLNFYKERLKTFGYIDITTQNIAAEVEPLVRNMRSRSPMYRLIFASKHELGGKLWQGVTKKDVSGQIKLF